MKMKRYAALVAAAGLTICTFGFSAGANAQAVGTPLVVASDENIITVQGTGEVEAAPDLARLTLGVQTQNVDAARAAQENATKSAALIAAIKSAGVADKDIQTSNYQINTQYDYSNRKPGDISPLKIIGYEVTNNVRVTVRKISDAGKVLDAGIGAGANDAGGISFDLSESTKAKAQTDALTRAVQNARTKADTLARAASVTIYSLYSISESGYGMVRPEYASPGGMMRTMTSAAAPPTPVQAGELMVSASVTIKYRVRSQ